MSAGKCQITKPAPDFSGTAVMQEGDFKDIKLSDYKGIYDCFFTLGNKVPFLSDHLKAK